MGSSSSDDNTTDEMLKEQLKDSNAQEQTARETAYATEENALKSAGTGTYMGVSQDNVNPNNDIVTPTTNKGNKNNV